MVENIYFLLLTHRIDGMIPEDLDKEERQKKEKKAKKLLKKAAKEERAVALNSECMLMHLFSMMNY